MAASFVLAATVAQVVQAAPAFAAGTITTPSANPFTVPESAGGAGQPAAGTPLPFVVQGGGWAANVNVLIEICDGNNPATFPGWDPTINCDLATSPAAESSPAGTPTFPATGTGKTIGDFRGIGPSDLFNCLAPQDVTGLTQNPDGSWPVTASSTANNETIDPAQSSWTNCQLRMSTNDTAVTTDQVFLGLTIPNTPAAPTVSVTLGASPASPQPPGTSITLTATLTPSGSAATPTGTLAFSDNGTGITGCGTVAVATPTCTWTPSSSGANSLTVHYSGDGTYPQTTSSPLPYTISSTTVTVTLSANPPSPQPTGTPISLTATVTPSGSAITPNGTLAFFDGATGISGCSAVALDGSCSWTASSVGDHSLTVQYSGDGTYPQTTSAPVTFTVSAPSGPAISVPSANPFAVPESPGGTDLPAAGTPLPFLIEGAGWGANQNVLVEICDGNAPTIPNWDPTINCDLATSPAGESSPSGSPTFPATGTGKTIGDFRGEGPSDLFNCLAPEDVSGLTQNPDGSWPVTATATVNKEPIDPAQPAWTNCQLRMSTNDTTVTTDQQFIGLTIPDTAAGTQAPTVTLSALPASPQDSGTAVQLSATVTGGSGTPTGTLDFVDGSSSIPGCSLVPVTTGTCSWTAAPAGVHQLTVEYSGDSTYKHTVSSVLDFTVNHLATSVNLSASPPGGSVEGQVVTITATLTGTSPTPTGVVAFKVGGATIVGCPDQPVAPNGIAICETTLLPVGNDNLTAAYGGDLTYPPATSAALPYTVASSPVGPRLTPSLFLSMSPKSGLGVGQPVEFAMVASGAAGLASGSLTMSVRGRPLAGCDRVPLRSGLALCITRALPIGRNTVVGMYSGNAAYLPGTVSRVVTVGVFRSYRVAGSDGSVFGFGSAPSLGSLAGRPLSKPVVGMAETQLGDGYWLVAADGGIFPFGRAGFHGSTGNVRLNKPIVGMAPTADGRGYWLVASDGGVFQFGDARFYGSTGNVRLNKPIVGMAPTADGRGYWLVASDGGIFQFGDARFYGSTGSVPLNRPIVGMARTADGRGYWLVASDGGIFEFGDARFFGSTGNVRLNRPIVGMAAAPDNHGYWLVASDGGVFPFGDAGYSGSAASLALAAPVVAISAG